jgi:hypothetical protein
MVIYKGNNVCLSVCVGSAWKILPITAHTDRQIDTVQGWLPCCPPFMDRERAANKGGPTRGGGGQHGWGVGRERTNGCIMHRDHTSGDNGPRVCESGLLKGNGS